MHHYNVRAANACRVSDLRASCTRMNRRPVIGVYRRNRVQSARSRHHHKSMSSDSRSRRSGRQARGAPPEQETGAPPLPRPLVSLLARATHIMDVLPWLHQHAVASTGGACSLLLEHSPRSGVLHPTSGFRLESLSTDPLLAGGEELAV